MNSGCKYTREEHKTVFRKTTLNIPPRNTMQINDLIMDKDERNG